MISASVYKNKLAKLEGRFDVKNKTRSKLVTAIEDNKENLASLELAQAFIQQVAKDTQEQLRFQISDIVQLALDTCFPDEYKFTVNFEIKRGKTEASLLFMKDGIEIDPMDASGGGVVDLASFALRIAAWSLGKSDNVIILDEPFRFLSKDLHPKAGLILRRLSEHLKLQIIMVTHSEDIIECAHKVFEISQNKKTGVSKIVVKENV